MRKSKPILFLLILCLAVTLCVPALAVDTPANYSAGGEAQPAPEIHARCALLCDLESGQTYYARNADQKAYPASLTKIMTVLLALEALDRGEVQLTDQVTAGADARQGLDEESSTAGIQPGETMTFEQYLYCAMISSANEACNVIGAHLAGSIDAFVQRMNDRAAELGCTGTHFMNPHGMPDDNHYTTAADLRLITEEALKYPLFETISNTLSYSIPATNMSDARVLQNTNGLINPNAVMYPNYLYEPAAGIKTGHTNAAGYCLISTAEKNTVKLLCIVLGSDTSEKDDGTLDFHNFTDTIDLYEWLYNHFSIQTVVSADSPMADVAVEMGSDADRVTVHPQADLAAVLPNDTDLSLYEKKITIFSERDETPVVAPVHAGDVLGELEVSKDGQVLGTIPLVASVDVSLSHAVFLKQGLHNFFAKPVVLIALLLILAVVILYLISYIRYQRRRRLRAQEMRRRRQQEEALYRRQQEEAMRREFEGRGTRRR